MDFFTRHTDFSLQKKLEIENSIVSTIFQKVGNIDFDAKNYWTLGGLGSSIIEMDGFLLAIPLLGICLSAYGAQSIAAAERATIALRDSFQEQFQHAAVEDPKKYGLEHAFYIRKNPLLILPSIVGGGKDGNDADGYGISRRMPRAMMWGWLISIVYSFIDLIVNHRYIMGIFH